ncbi:MAG TPA: CusA/CzcA family heavy metal efflux RND transporter [Candidatus Gastranaerophilales bacterium]|nr:CusA/CzcA family heavy metal efflux RND transporter [Candidatus Gastranaerophilales bacterium]
MLNKVFNFVLKNKLFVIFLAVLIVGLGVHSYKKLPIEAFPDVSPNLVQVFTITEGLAPEEIEKYVTYPVEASMNGLPGIEKIRSVSNFGLSVVNVYFKDDVDIYFARQLVNERLQEAAEYIPDGFGQPEMGPISTGMGLILFYYLKDETGKYSLTELRTIQDWIVKFYLQTVPGVTEVLGIGGHEKQFQVLINPDSMLSYGLTINEIIEKIKQNNLNTGAQFITKGSEEFIVRSVGLVDNIEDIKKIVLKTHDGVPVLLGQVAQIKEGGAIRRGLQTRNGNQEVVSGMVVKLFGENSSTVIKRVEDKISEINNILPEGVGIVPYYEQKSLVEACINTVTSALFLGILLVIAVVTMFMKNWHSSIIVALSIPFSILFALTGMYFFGISANLMSFGGLAIAIGMLVDGTIVIVENTERILKQGNGISKIELLKKSFSEVGKPIVFTTLIVIVVFLPLFLLGGVEGKTFRPLAYTVALAMAGSLIYSILIAPAFIDFLMKIKNDKENQYNWISKIQDKYTTALQYFLNRKKFVMSLVGGLFAVGLLIYSNLGSEFTPTLQEGTIIVRLTMAPSISIEESKNLTHIVERRILKVPEVSEVVSRIGRGEVGAHTDPINSAEIYVLLKDKSKWRSGIKGQKDLQLKIREELGEVPGLMFNFTQPIKMTVDELMEGIKSDLAIKLFGSEIPVLKEKAEDISSVIREIKGASDVQVDQVSGTPQLLVKINRDAIARYGINISDIQQTLRAAIGGETAGQLFDGIKRFDIYVRFSPEFRKTKEDIEKLFISNSDGLKVPLSQLVEISEIISSRQITRENNERFITIQCNVTGRDIGSFVEEAQKAIKEEIKLPPGYLVSWGGQYELQQEANKRLAVITPITLILIFIMLYTNFRSKRYSALILLNIPLALVGGVFSLWITGQNLSVPASVGFISLFGIAIGNGMVLISCINHLIKDNISIDEALIKGGSMRLRAVLMTAATTALGLVPLLLATGTGSEVQRPLATVVFGGLFTSTLVTLFILPVFYKLIPTKENL